MFLNDMSTIVRYSHIFLNRSLSDHKISAAENYILMYLFQRDNITQDEIASYFAIDKGSISKSVHRLEENGYVLKEPNPDNRRENRIALTKLGRQRFSESRRLLDEWHKAVMKDISKDEFRQLNIILSKMAANAVMAIESNE